MDLKNKTRPYRTVHDEYAEKFHRKVFKIALNGDFTCPNRDGTLGVGGCIFCSDSGSGEFGGNKTKSLKDQFEEVLTMMSKKWSDGAYIAYFQANSNTYAPVERLRELFEEALSLSKDIIGLSIATRPDCLPQETVDYLGELNHRTFLTVELGLQTIHDETAKLIHRGHDLSIFVDAVKRLREKRIDVVVHIINSLPHESKDQMIETIKFLNQLDIQGIKIHMLYILKDTPMARYYEQEVFHLMTLPEYVDVTVEQLRHLREDIVVHRLTGDAPRDELIAPLWSLKKFVVTNEIDKLMRSLGAYQGEYHDLHR